MGKKSKETKNELKKNKLKNLIKNTKKSKKQKSIDYISLIYTTQERCVPKPLTRNPKTQRIDRTWNEYGEDLQLIEIEIELDYVTE